ncbi:1,6-anhydro-N-acetylmuramyl-L-alanine amidase AmpD [Candidatus Marithioploca araucensis]|uniref:1,6-anhydro-N-acetylmuramyl-L-alanine amidase AmpD n=1 Tax=Candidatus Marithioploca araucensis TaxID=70273 RepID=A0ABT7VWI1_9GAMM|nr:1,6-anhydro-N-acetylmuramyl-L-alanine amidase AmpD [Candidatus Marithioploca araucensis]
MMKLDSDKAWLEEVRRHPSPNYDDRPKGIDIELLVIHAISLPPGEFGGPFIDQLFTSSLDKNAHPDFADIADLRVSAHLLIRRTGEVIQYVSFQQRAWHAGVSSFAGRSRCNDFSIGIELEGCDDVPYTDEQYQQLAQIIKILQQAWVALTPDRIVGHCDIAPGRKTDPGAAFDWARLHALI